MVKYSRWIPAAGVRIIYPGDASYQDRYKNRGICQFEMKFRSCRKILYGFYWLERFILGMSARDEEISSSTHQAYSPPLIEIH